MIYLALVGLVYGAIATLSVLALLRSDNVWGFTALFMSTSLTLFALAGITLSVLSKKKKNLAIETRKLRVIGKFMFVLYLIPFFLEMAKFFLGINFPFMNFVFYGSFMFGVAGITIIIFERWHLVFLEYLAILVFLEYLAIQDQGQTQDSNKESEKSTWNNNSVGKLHEYGGLK